MVPRRFVWFSLLQEVEFPHGSSDYEFTKLGKIPFGELSLIRFNQVQEPLLLEKLSELEEKVERAQDTNSLFLPERIIDLRLYRTQLKTILQTTLYYLEITADRNTFYKVGITKRSIKERVVEVQRELLSHFKVVTINILGTWDHRGNVEKYFNYRYEKFNYRISSLTKYYKFDSTEDAKAVLQDLRQMKNKILCQAEDNILSDQPSQIEAAIHAEQKRQCGTRCFPHTST